MDGMMIRFFIYVGIMFLIFGGLFILIQINNDKDEAFCESLNLGWRENYCYSIDGVYVESFYIRKIGKERFLEGDV